MTSFFSAEGGSIWIKFRRLVHNEMSTAVIRSKSKPDVEFQYGRRLGEFHGISYLPHYRVMPLGEFTVMIPQPHATVRVQSLDGNQCHDRATLQGVIIPSVILKVVFSPYFIFIFICLNAVWALTSDGFRIVSDTLVLFIY